MLINKVYNVNVKLGLQKPDARFLEVAVFQQRGDFADDVPPQIQFHGEIGVLMRLIDARAHPNSTMSLSNIRTARSAPGFCARFRSGCPLQQFGHFGQRDRAFGDEVHAVHDRGRAAPRGPAARDHGHSAAQQPGDNARRGAAANGLPAIEGCAISASSPSRSRLNGGPVMTSSRAGLAVINRRRK